MANDVIEGNEQANLRCTITYLNDVPWDHLQSESFTVTE